MPSTFTYPGVYVTERPSGAQAVPAAATSIALFVGMADIGPFDTPVRIQNLSSYVRTFGETSVGEMADQVKQFFINGGADCYVMRIADGERQSEIRVRDETGTTDVLRILARDAGKAGNLIRVEVDYQTATPELTFNLTAYRSVLNADGTFGRTDIETLADVSMDPLHPRYVETIAATSSTLIRVENLAAAPAPGNTGGVSVAGLFLTTATALTDLRSVIDATHRSLSVSIAGRPPVTAVVNLTGLDDTNPHTRIEEAIYNAYQGQDPLPAGSLTVVITNGPGALGSVLEIQSEEGAVIVSRAATNDLTSVLMLGSTNGGVEFDAYSRLRPAPSGVFAQLGTTNGRPTSAWLNRLFAVAAFPRDQVTTLTSLADPGSSSSPYTGPIAIAGVAADPVAHVPIAAPFPAALGSMEAVRAGLDAIADGIEAAVSATTPGRWTAQRQGVRLVLRPAVNLAPATSLGVEVATGPADLGAAGSYLDRTTSANLAAYTLGTAAPGGQQTGDVAGLDGTKPLLTDYQAAFAVIESNVEIFNMMVLPRAPQQTDADRQTIWGAASNFCAQQRAILFVDPADWRTIGQAEAGAGNIKLGVDTRNSVIYWPRVLVPGATSPRGVAVDPSGTMAGLYARTDTRFGTWKAPAGIEATLTGVLGVEVPMSDAENGRINPKALNAIRVFPSGVTSWGARTMVGADDTGNVDDKYVNVRRTMLFIENSLYRGLRFAVFRSNAEPLWASIRLAAGAFMNGLMLQGAFASTTKSEAYYVLCDSTTTTPNDINLGIVNVLVGFAPNKPAEFVHLIVTQLAGQVEA
ncbi:phage tail sheath family protein [Nocardia amamiensis]|uniref:phage tail sheath family protein n=1 Tax=Nocardia amamiensis TaxID=404578 RepID=UPI000830CC96|nr:phage tail sheath subtilisin-like domain-containing protein [Nocardia amamiensis]